jgi:hypothetical protein
MVISRETYLVVPCAPVSGGTHGACARRARRPGQQRGPRACAQFLDARGLITLTSVVLHEAGRPLSTAIMHLRRFRPAVAQGEVLRARQP